MSLLYSSKEGWIISHLQYLDEIYKDVKDSNESKRQFSLQFNKTLFDINSKFLRRNQLADTKEDKSIGRCEKRKRKKSNFLSDNFLNEIKYVRQTFDQLMQSNEAKEIFSETVASDNNEAARWMSRQLYSDPENLNECFIIGRNINDFSVVALLENKKFVIPKNCEYYCADVREIDQTIPLKNEFDFILIDPPWWNKSIRRKKTKFKESSYEMMYKEELVKLPVEKLLSMKGIIAIWCTNSVNNLNFILKEMFPTWGITFQAKWYWVKVTQSGKVVCDFNEFHGKQPYELLIIGTAVSNLKTIIPTDKLVVSIPSAMHSHKPPLTEIMAPYLSSNPKCLEIFARYLLPNWTSWGFEALKFQHISFFNHSNIKKEDSEIT